MEKIYAFIIKVMIYHDAQVLMLRTHKPYVVTKVTIPQISSAGALWLTTAYVR